MEVLPAVWPWAPRQLGRVIRGIAMLRAAALLLMTRLH